MNDDTPKIALVTGATGFVGSHLTRRLVRDDWQVHVIVRSDSNLDQLKEAKQKVVVHLHDGGTECMSAILEDARPEIVFHLASLFISEHQPREVIPLIESNLLFGTQLLEAMKGTGCNCLVNTGTSWQHYQDEEDNPVNLYAATKQAFEDILRYYLEATELKAVTLKLFDTYGPDDPRPKLINLLKIIAENGETLAMSPGEQLIDLVHIDDVVEAFLIAADRLLSGACTGHEGYAVSSGAPVPLRDLVQVIARALGREILVDWGARPYREREVMIPWHGGDSPPFWHPRIQLEEGIRNVCRGV